MKILQPLWVPVSVFSYLTVAFLVFYNQVELPLLQYVPFVFFALYVQEQPCSVSLAALH